MIRLLRTLAWGLLLGCDAPSARRAPAPESCAELVAGTPCDDGDACTAGDRCDDEGRCVGPARVQCDDGELCNGRERCDPELGCTAGDAIVCDDEKGCTLDRCDESARGCVHEPDHTVCLEGELCDPTDGVCRSGATCAGDAECDDGFLCNGEELCAGGLCIPTPGRCDDGISCTEDVCEEDGSCTHRTLHARCLDDDWCNGEERCDARSGCMPADVAACEDGRACTDDACHEATHTCGASVPRCPEGQLCNDDVGCFSPSVFRHEEPAHDIEVSYLDSRVEHVISMDGASPGATVARLTLRRLRIDADASRGHVWDPECVSVRVAYGPYQLLLVDGYGRSGDGGLDDDVEDDDDFEFLDRDLSMFEGMPANGDLVIEITNRQPSCTPFRFKADHVERLATP